MEHEATLTADERERVSEPRGPSVWERALPIAGEVAVAVGAALVVTLYGRYVVVNPLRRTGQVSGLAAIQLVALMLMAALLLLLPLGQRLGRRRLALRLACGGFSGVFSGVLAAGVTVALRGSAWPLGAQSGDAGVLQMWADAVLDGRSTDQAYPPAYLYLVAGWARLFSDGLTGPALHWTEILVTAMIAPAAYLAWRMLLPPLWALGIGVLATAPLANPYKPFAGLVLAVFIPVIGKLFQVLQRAPELDRRRAVGLGAGLGLLLGLLFLAYSGWFVWSLPGVAVVAAVLLGQHRFRSGSAALKTALLTLGAAGASFGVVAGWYLVRLLGASGTVDRYCYFDAYTEPTYFAMWRDDLPGLDARSSWPPPGELAGVGLFAVVLLVGLAVALSLGLGRPAILAAAGCAASAFGLRYWLAARMERDQAVQLYPRTSQQILYCLLVLTGLAVFLVVGRIRGLIGSRLSTGNGDDGDDGDPDDGTVAWRTALGALCGLGLLFGMAGSATAMRYMPDETERSSGHLAWVAHTIRNPSGECSPYAPDGTCSDYDRDLDLVAGVQGSELACFTYDGFPARP